MEKEVKFNSESLLDIKFEKDVKGYNPLEVDKTLDEVIKDYKVYEEETSKSEKELFWEYIKFGGLPAIHFMNKNENLIWQYLTDVFNSVILKDVIERNKIKSSEKLISTIIYELAGPVISKIAISKNVIIFVLLIVPILLN